MVRRDRLGLEIRDLMSLEASAAAGNFTHAAGINLCIQI